MLLAGGRRGTQHLVVCLQAVRPPFESTSKQAKRQPLGKGLAVIITNLCSGNYYLDYSSDYIDIYNVDTVSDEAIDGIIIENGNDQLDCPPPDEAEC